MEVVEVFLLVTLFAIRVISLTLLYIIWSYLKKKSPVLQTLKDEMIKEVIWSSHPLNISLDLIFIGIGPIPKEVAYIILFTVNWAFAYFFMQVLIAVIVKYLIIFYGYYIELVNDEMVVKFSRIFCWIWALSTALWHSQNVDISKSTYFLALTTGVDQDLTEQGRECGPSCPR